MLKQLLLFRFNSRNLAAKLNIPNQLYSVITSTQSKLSSDYTKNAKLYIKAFMDNISLFTKNLYNFKVFLANIFLHGTLKTKKLIKTIIKSDKLTTRTLNKIKLGDFPYEISDFKDKPKEEDPSIIRVVVLPPPAPLAAPARPPVVGPIIIPPPVPPPTGFVGRPPVAKIGVAPAPPIKRVFAVPVASPVAVAPMVAPMAVAPVVAAPVRAAVPVPVPSVAAKLKAAVVGAMAAPVAYAVPSFASHVVGVAPVAAPAAKVAASAKLLAT